MEPQELKEYLVNNITETQLLDYLDMDMEALVEALSDQILEKKAYLEEQLGLSNVAGHSDTSSWNTDS